MIAENMKIKKLIKYYFLGESIKEIELNRILDKINSKSKLTERERNFIELYQTTREDEMKDYMLLSKNSAFEKLSELLGINKRIICDLHDSQGKFGLEIKRVENDFESDACTIYMRGDEKHKLKDNFLYNIIYNIKKDQYSLQEQDEYYEKIEAKNDN